MKLLYPVDDATPAEILVHDASPTSRRYISFAVTAGWLPDGVGFVLVTPIYPVPVETDSSGIAGGV